MGDSHTIFESSIDHNKVMKPFCSIDELINKLKTAEINPLSFDANEILFAQEFFTYTNYYSFSIYRKHLDLSQYLGHILVETAKTFSLFLNLQTPVELSNESNYGFDYDYKILQCS